MKVNSKIVEEFFEWLGNCINFSKDNLGLIVQLLRKILKRMRYIRERIQVPYKSEQRRLENSHISGGGKFVLKKTSSWCENFGEKIQDGKQLY